MTAILAGTAPAPSLLHQIFLDFVTLDMVPLETWVIAESLAMDTVMAVGVSKDLGRSVAVSLLLMGAVGGQLPVEDIGHLDFTSF